MDNASAPLADYFWIAGIEHISYQDFPLPATSKHVETTIEEDGEHDEHSPRRDSIAGMPTKATARHSRQNSDNRLSRASVKTLEEVDGNTRSNRSSATIRPNPPPGGHSITQFDGIPAFLEGFDFDEALLKFAAERENFLEDLSFTAGAKTHARPPMVNPRAERIKADETASGRMSPLKNLRGSIRGSIRRKISFKDMNSVRKQPAPAKAGKLPLSFDVFAR